MKKVLLTLISSDVNTFNIHLPIMSFNNFFNIQYSEEMSQKGFWLSSFYRYVSMPKISEFSYSVYVNCEKRSAL